MISINRLTYLLLILTSVPMGSYSQVLLTDYAPQGYLLGPDNIKNEVLVCNIFLSQCKKAAANIESEQIAIQEQIDTTQATERTMLEVEMQLLDTLSLHVASISEAWGKIKFTADRPGDTSFGPYDVVAHIAVSYVAPQDVWGTQRDINCDSDDPKDCEINCLISTDESIVFRDIIGNYYSQKDCPAPMSYNRHLGQCEGTIDMLQP